MQQIPEHELNLNWDESSGSKRNDGISIEKFVEK